MKLDEKKLFYTFLTLTALLLLFGVGTKLFVNKVTDNVIQKLKQDYSPSPYGPTIDPDKVDLNELLK